jgi:Polyketide cyclase / dehydrase and lipid transport
MRIERSIELPCGAEEAWRVLTDWERQADWMRDADAVVVTSSMRSGTGVTLEVRTRLFQIPAFTETIEVTAWDPPSRLTIEHGSPVHGHGEWSLASTDDGSRLTWVEEVELEAPLLGWLLTACYAPVLGVVMRRSMRGLRASIIARGPERA